MHALNKSIDLLYLYNSGLPEEINKGVKRKSIINTLYKNIRILMSGVDMDNSFNVDIRMDFKIQRNTYRTNYKFKIGFISSFDKTVDMEYSIDKTDNSLIKYSSRLGEIETLTLNILTSTLDGILNTFGYKVIAKTVVR